ncbi:MAG: ATP-dependent Clp protease ATP-binding subunit ClpA [Acidobacteria bacterium]|nr:ATP-dependent Clp protease ATP-binding subunit ClpA [Acidobacteriota bacterium]
MSRSEPPPLTRSLQGALSSAYQASRERRHEFITLEHLLLGLLSDPLAQDAVRACGGDPARLQSHLAGFLEEKLDPLPGEGPVDPMPTLGFQRVMEHAILHAMSSEKPHLDSGSVLVSLLREKDSHAVHHLRQEGVERLPLLRFLSHGAAAAPQTSPPDPQGPGPEAEDGEAPVRDPLAAYAVDLTDRARAGGIDPLIGRDEEVARVVQILCRRRKNNPLLVGEPGVGKTAIAEGLALRIVEGKVPEPLAGSTLYALDLGSLLAGTRYRGDFEQRVKAVLEALRGREKSLLFIDELHTVVGAGASSGGSVDASNLLKPALQSGELRCIGATTFQDAKHSLDRDRALSRRFQKVEVGEPSAADTLAILQGLKAHYEAHHAVRFSDAALESAVTLSDRHLRELKLPDKALDVLDEAGAAQKLLPPRKRRKVIGVPEIEAVVARMARVPVQTVSRDDRQALARLEPELKAVVFGQDEAVEKVAAAIKLARSGLRGLEKPIGSFLFAGPTGVGKTELARQLARVLGVSFHRFDMSEYMEKHAVSRLIGAPPGYVGFEDAGLLTDAVRRDPHAVLLLDEIEKAHPDLFAILLQVMDHATLTDNHGRRADFRHVVLVMTTNAGARDLSARRVGFAAPGSGGSAKGAIEKAFSPEFRNRLDAVLHFKPLGEAVVLKVVDKNLRELQALLDEKGVVLQVDPEARRWLAKKGFDPAFGARPMARLIEEKLKKPLADEILFGKLQGGGRLRVRLDGDALVLRPGR